MRVCFFVCAASVSSSCAPIDLCVDGFTPRVEQVQPRADNGLFHAAHAHNDYEHERPLLDALAAGFTSVEVDVWHRDGAIAVSHDAFTSKGSLSALYLDELDAILDVQDSVHGDGAPFTLWIDLKDNTPELRELLATQLNAYGFLTRYDDDGVVEAGAVDVILTGDAGSKTALVDETDAPRPFARDSNDLTLDEEEDAGVVASALSFSKYLGAWDGTAPAPPDLARRCACAVDASHDVGRRLRFFGGPDTEASWRLQLANGVDFVNADDLDALHDLLEAGL